MRLIGLEDLAPYIDAEPDESPHIRPASEYVEQVIDLFYGDLSTSGAVLPWNKCERNIVFRPGEMTLWLGINGHGKSLMLGQLMLHWMSGGDKAVVASFEMRPARTMQRMSRQAATCEEPSIRFIRDFHAWTDDKLWMYDQQGTVNSRRVLAVCRYAAKEIHVQHVIIDSLLKCGYAEDDYNGQKQFVDELTACARDNGMHIHLVHHSRKLADESRAPGKFDAKGTGSITDLVDNCVTIWRNKPKEKETRKNNGVRDDDKPDAVMIVDKQRNGEWEGAINLWFHPQSANYLDSPKAQPRAWELERDHDYSEEF
jgi:twinkle protein